MNSKTLPSTFPYPLIDIKQSFDCAPPTLNYAFPKLGILAGTVAMINGQGAIGKSWFVLQLSAYLSCNLDVMGFGDNQGNRKVLMLAGEDPKEILSQRLHVLGKMMTATQKSFFEANTTIASCLGKTGDFMDGGKTTTEISEVSGNYGLVIIDTLSRWHSGEENDRKDAAKVMRKLEEIANTGPAVIVLHHIGKATIASQQHASRGSTVWSDESRWVGYLEAVTSEDAKKFGITSAETKSMVRFGVSKANYAKKLSPILLERGLHGELLGTNNLANQMLVVKPASVLKKEVSDANDF